MAHIGQGAAEDLYPAQKVQDCAVKTKTAGVLRSSLRGQPTLKNKPTLCEAIQRLGVTNLARQTCQNYAVILARHSEQYVHTNESYENARLCSRLGFWFSDTWFSLLWFAKRLKPVPFFAREKPLLERFLGFFAELWYFSQNESGGFRSLRKMVAFIP